MSFASFFVLRGLLGSFVMPQIWQFQSQFAPHDLKVTHDLILNGLGATA
jgi:hypothetical protein